MAVDAGKMNIAVICNSVPPYRLHLHRRIASELKSVRLHTLQTHEDDGRWTDPSDGAEIGLIRFSNISCAEQGRHFREEWLLGGRLIRWISRNKVQAIVLYGYNDLSRIRVIFWCWAHRIPCMLCGDSNAYNWPAPTRIKRYVKQAVLGILLRFCPAVLPFGRAGKTYFRQYGVPARRIFSFPMEPDYGLIQGMSRHSVEAVRQQYSLPSSRRRILFCGRLIPLKRLDLLLDAFAAIAERRPEWDLVILGDGPLRAELAARVPPQFRSRVIWAGHTSDRTTVAAVQLACNVLVLPSDSEAWGMVINEALAAGLAVVCSSVPGVAHDLVRDGVNGRIFPRGDVAALEQCLLEITDEKRLLSMQAQAPVVLREWIARADPIEGLRRALASVGVKVPAST